MWILTSPKIGIELTGTMHSCNGCVMSEVLKYRVASLITSRAKTLLQDILVDVLGPKSEAMRKGERYTIVFQYHSARYS